MSIRMRRRTAPTTITALTASLLLSALAGCRIAAIPFILWGQPPTKLVPAEYPYLTGKKVCIVVWADNYTLLEYPFVQLEISEYVRRALEQHVQRVRFVSNRTVVDYQRSDPDWQHKHPAVIGARFHADRVLLIELTQYTTREPESTFLYRGRISANIKVYDPAYPDAGPAYKTVVETVWPEEASGQWGTNEDEIRKQTMEAFAAQVAARFHDRRVKVR